MIKWMRYLVGAVALCGLCIGAQANTTTTTVTDDTPVAQTSAIILSPTAVSVPLGAPLPPAEPMPLMPVVPTSLVNSPATNALIRIAVLLPLKSPTLGNAAQAVLAGVKAGYERESSRLTIDMIDTDGSTADAVRGYNEAVANHDIVIGPLSRSEVAAVAQAVLHGAKTQPTVALSPAGTDAVDALPRNMLAVGLSIEEEARQVADWVGVANPTATVFAISTDVIWQKRAAAAFATQAASYGLNVQQIELPLIDGYLNADDLVDFKKRIQRQNPALLFVGFDARIAAQLRLAIGSELPIYGTSQLNPRTLDEWRFSEPIEALEGMRLVDIPWQLQSDHPAVMTYPHLLSSPEQPNSPVTERLYALGIDAFRIAREIALARTYFSIDGVTGKLSINFNGVSTDFKRIETPALYQNGVIVPLTVGQKPLP